ncbi:MAG: 3-methyl-2-oxobutanoate hydroxymethyltransferase [Candidatus Aminicenantaceae bacterium]
MPKNNSQKITIPSLYEKKDNNEKIIALTAYDYPVGKIIDETGIDIILVGDSLGMVVLGYENTIAVTMDEMIHHTKPVARSAQRAFVIGDMPYFSFHLSIEQSVFNASRFIKEGGAKAVKIEGASPKRLELIRALVEAEIPVMGHVGLTPQSINHLGQFKVRGKEVEEAKKIITDALNLEEAGVFSVVLECIPKELAKIITKKLKVPTIGIGAGPFCDGQILVFHDLVGFSNGYLPKFVKKYADFHKEIHESVTNYINDVRSGSFPSKIHSYHLNPDKLKKIEKEIN